MISGCYYITWILSQPRTQSTCWVRPNFIIYAKVKQLSSSLFLCACFLFFKMNSKFYHVFREKKWHCICRIQGSCFDEICQCFWTELQPMTRMAMISHSFERKCVNQDLFEWNTTAHKMRKCIRFHVSTARNFITCCMLIAAYSL